MDETCSRFAGNAGHLGLVSGLSIVQNMLAGTDPSRINWLLHERSFLLRACEDLWRKMATYLAALCHLSPQPADSFEAVSLEGRRKLALVIMTAAVAFIPPEA